MLLPTQRELRRSSTSFRVMSQDDILIQRGNKEVTSRADVRELAAEIIWRAMFDGDKGYKGLDRFQAKRTEPMIWRRWGRQGGRQA